jgi:hypothetical protein
VNHNGPAQQEFVLPLTKFGPIIVWLVNSAHSDFFNSLSSPIQKYEIGACSSTTSSTSFRFFHFRSLASELASDEAFAVDLVVVFNFWSRCDRRLHHRFLHSLYVRHCIRMLIICANLTNVICTDDKYQPSDEDFEALLSLQSDFQKCVVSFLLLLLFLI